MDLYKTEELSRDTGVKELLSLWEHILHPLSSNINNMKQVAEQNEALLIKEPEVRSTEWLTLYLWNPFTTDSLRSYVLC